MVVWLSGDTVIWLHPTNEPAVTGCNRLSDHSFSGVTDRPHKHPDTRSRSVPYNRSRRK
ncbi:hypothetical protein AAH068_19300 [Bacteroides uniformis]|uniref:hypothetical protein n=1 Tax=Bacteroides uniformis TaxID=820 RepID=UPI0039B6B4B1